MWRPWPAGWLRSGGRGRPRLWFLTVLVVPLGMCAVARRQRKESFSGNGRSSGQKPMTLDRAVRPSGGVRASVSHIRTSLHRRGCSMQRPIAVLQARVPTSRSPVRLHHRQHASATTSACPSAPRHRSAPRNRRTALDLSRAGWPSAGPQPSRSGTGRARPAAACGPR